jgi:uncharacterized membrane protein YuzA (DUF378 family)
MKMELDKKIFYDTSEILLIIGGLNWALTGFGDTNLIDYVPGDIAKMIVYGLVGAAAIYQIWYKWFK